MKIEAFQAAGFLLTAVLALVLCVLVFALLRFLLRFSTDAIGQIIRALLRLSVSAVLDPKFSCASSVIFCLVAERSPSSHMPRVALIFSASVFALTVLNICFFLIHAAFLQRLQRVSQGISDDKVRKFVNDEALQIQLNIGFLGLIFLCVSFSSLCYSYYLFFRTQDASAYQWKVNEAAIGQLDQQYELEESFERNDSEGDKDDPSGNPQKRFMYDKVDYNSFSNHTLREIKTCFPAFVQDRIGVGEPMFTVPKEALGLQIITWTFRKAFWGALIALIWAIAQPSRIFHAL